VYRFATDAPLNLEELRTHLRKMDAQALRQFGRAAAYLCTLEANHGRDPRDAFVIQLSEARLEWRARRKNSPE
jgi:hypothetical protein